MGLIGYLNKSHNCPKVLTNGRDGYSVGCAPARLGPLAQSRETCPLGILQVHARASFKLWKTGAEQPLHTNSATHPLAEPPCLQARLHNITPALASPDHARGRPTDSEIDSEASDPATRTASIAITIVNTASTSRSPYRSGKLERLEQAELLEL